MFGVVLWSDPTGKNAVIWCEDQGDLAYYQGGSDTHPTQAEFPDAGDYVLFDMDVENNVRVVKNPRTVHSGPSERLANALLAAAQQARAEAIEASNLIRLQDRARPQRVAEPEFLVSRHG